MRNKSIRPRNKKGQQHGYWEMYWFDNQLMFKRFFHNGKRLGYEEYYRHTDGKISKKRNYV
jgi:hypothetical protein